MTKPVQATLPSGRESTYLSWSSGKDSAWALHVLGLNACDVRGLLTSCNGEHERVAMHGVRNALLAAQAESLGLPLRRVDLPSPCTNSEYEASMNPVLQDLKAQGIDGVAFGDLLLEDVRAYREQQVQACDLSAWFPIFGSDTHALAREMIDAGLRAIITCVDPKQCPAEFAGAEFDLELLDSLPDSVDPCGENGEFHSFAYDGPMFSYPVDVQVGEVVERGGFVFADLLPADSTQKGHGHEA